MFVSSKVVVGLALVGGLLGAVATSAAATEGGGGGDVCYADTNTNGCPSNDNCGALCGSHWTITNQYCSGDTYYCVGTFTP
jgi:hypothetical protein